MLMIRPLPLLFSLLLFMRVRQSATPDPDEGADWLANRLPERTWANAQAAHPRALFMESLLNIPRGGLRPIYMYDPNYQYRAIAEHLDSYQSRYMELWVDPERRSSIYASPWFVTTPRSDVPTRGLLFLQFERSGTVTPILLSGIRTEDLWDYVTNQATNARGDLESRFGGRLWLSRFRA
ncbi:uncharacterized protein UTRI_06191_B [Ustilago trichophora]|uniref:Uncharacterized protein n=1 Tax=Ustilago trichophora TaxID=86804 RepID=A0A5C3EHN4_9BASI|nr:uncharacterized protein UTRI_06191_B [Ustilago trichophora]